MNFSYDDTDDALYIELSTSLVDQTHQIDAGTMVDVDNFGRVVGIEVLRPARDWPLEAIKERFQLDSDAKKILDSLWGHQNPARIYTFAKPIPTPTNRSRFSSPAGRRYRSYAQFI